MSGIVACILMCMCMLLSLHNFFLLFIDCLCLLLLLPLLQVLNITLTPDLVYSAQANECHVIACNNTEMFTLLFDSSEHVDNFVDILAACMHQVKQDQQQNFGGARCVHVV